MQFQSLESRPAAASVPISTPMRRRTDVVNAALIDRYRAHGGVASPDEVIRLMRPHWRQPVSILAKWILSRRVVSFAWRMQMLLPIFQFVRPRMAPSQTIADCSRELGDSMDDHGFAAWFVQPCEWLDQKMPVDLLLGDPNSVVDAAARTCAALASQRFADSELDRPAASRLDCALRVSRLDCATGA